MTYDDPLRFGKLLVFQWVLEMMNIRRFRSGDLADVARLFNDYRVFYEKTSGLALAERFIADRQDRGESIILVADPGHGKLFGFTQIYPTFCSVAAAPIHVLYDLYVSPDSRRNGVARLLLQAAIALAEESGVCRVDLTTARTNSGAQALYERLGWKRDEKFFSYGRSILPGCS